MKNGIYASAAGMLTMVEKLNTIANNIANANTNGYKEDISFAQTIRFLDQGPVPGKEQPVIGGSVMNMHNGVLKQTGRKLDVAIEGPGFFAVQGPGNTELYTRNGAFALNSNKELVTSEGLPVLDKFNNKITLFGTEHALHPSGDITVDGNYYTTIKIADLQDRSELEKAGHSFVTRKDPSQPPQLIESPRLIPGSLEKSNMNIIEGMTEMIKVQRSFDLQKTAGDVMLKIIRKATTEIAKPI